jgi:transcriptional regulator with XRE-family HTH domain
MKMKTGKALREAMDAESVDQTTFGRRIGMTQSGVSKILAGTRRPEIPTLKRITHCWANAARNISVLVAHLEDECTRAGWPDGAISIGPARVKPPDVLADLATIGAHAPELAAEIRALIATAARAARAGEIADAGAMLAAESRGDKYRTKRETREKPKK